jgi:hypothetical protein
LESIKEAGDLIEIMFWVLLEDQKLSVVQEYVNRVMTAKVICAARDGIRSQ